MEGEREEEDDRWGPPVGERGTLNSEGVVLGVEKILVQYILDLARYNFFSVLHFRGVEEYLDLDIKIQYLDLDIKVQHLDLDRKIIRKLRVQYKNIL